MSTIQRSFKLETVHHAHTQIAALKWMGTCSLEVSDEFSGLGLAGVHPAQHEPERGGPRGGQGRHPRHHAHRADNPVKRERLSTERENDCERVYQDGHSGSGFKIARRGSLGSTEQVWSRGGDGLEKLAEKDLSNALSYDLLWTNGFKR